VVGLDPSEAGAEEIDSFEMDEPDSEDVGMGCSETED
jgi:hypothetical protein